MSVYKAISAVMGDLAQTGISKSRKNQQQNYSFRGIDDVYNALAPLLAKHGLVILPRVISRDCVERVTAKGGAIFYVTVKCEFDFIAAEDGSSHCVTTYGEAMDSGDKATNKAMSAALKYACLQTLMIPTEGDNDADATTHEVVNTITPAQLGELIDLCSAAGRQPADIAKAMGVPDLAALPATRLDKVRDRLLALAKEAA
jgi:hypothetical protein